MTNWQMFFICACIAVSVAEVAKVASSRRLYLLAIVFAIASMYSAHL